ncbi:MAG TPA: hypothetical protein VM327_10310, partial [Candidatus Thermoplasmatota archaeon]|nr:hypothetical protein [Candidatus Thermoplasmatota archaeon]
MVLMTVPVLPVHAEPVPVVPQDVQDFLLGQLAFAMKLAQDPTHANETLQAEATAVPAFVYGHIGMGPPIIPPLPDTAQQVVCHVLRTVVITTPYGEIDPTNLLFSCTADLGGLLSYVCGGWRDVGNLQLVPQIARSATGTEIQQGGPGPNTDGLMVSYFVYYGTLRRGVCI